MKASTSAAQQPENGTNMAAENISNTGLIDTSLAEFENWTNAADTPKIVSCLLN